MLCCRPPDLDIHSPEERTPRPRRRFQHRKNLRRNATKLMLGTALHQLNYRTGSGQNAALATKCLFGAAFFCAPCQFIG
jgi:hypothetical protein